MTSLRWILLVVVLLAGLLAPGVVGAQQEGRRAEGALIYDGIPDVPVGLREALRPYQNVRSAQFVAWVPQSNRLLVATRFGATTQLHVVERPLGMRRQVTFGDDPVGGAVFGRAASPDVLLFASDREGDERTQIHRLDLDTGRTVRLTDGVSVNRSPRWAKTSRWFAHSTTARNGRDWDVVLRHADDATTGPLVVVQDSGDWAPVDWAPDDSMLLVRRSISALEMELHVVDMATGARRRLEDPLGPPAAYPEALFAENGRGVYFTSNRGSEFLRLHYHDLRHNVSKVLVEDLAADIGDLAQSRDGRFVAFTANEEGFSTVHLLNTNTLRRTTLNLPRGIVTDLRFHIDGDRLAMTLHLPDAPADAWVFTLRGESLERWTQSEAGGLPESRFVAPEVFHFRTFDRDETGEARRIPALLFRPRRPGPWPVAIDIHGGPESQARPYFDPFVQFLVAELGVAVIRPNVRGSTGYGRTFLALDDGLLREGAVSDIGALLDWVAVQPDLDATRVMTMGRSYGGFMSLASQVSFGPRLRAGISLYGITSFVTFLETTSEYRRDRRRVEYGDERVPEVRAFMERIAPLNNVDRLVNPLLIGQGLNDARVPWTESEQIVRAARARGNPAWYFIATNEGHSLARRENRDAWEAVAAHFIRTHLVEAPARPSSGPTPEAAP
ncbi:MAG: S9 family peptidase [Candidatus Sumerlaeia bacterium]|nr:S9 family peptidase [Candidatus Sumerlaeia bacterium]